MGSKYLLTSNRSELLRTALKSQNKTEEDLQQSITVVRDWIKQQEVPEIPNENIISNFVLFTKFQLDQTKKKLEMYYKCRIIIPELFSKNHPKLPHMMKAANFMLNIPLPQTTKEGYRVTFARIQENAATESDVFSLLAHTYNIAEIRINEDVAMGDIFVYDIANMNVDLVIQFTPPVIKKMLWIMENVFSNRVKEINFINAPSVAQTLIGIVKSLMKPKLAERLQVHSNLDSLYQSIPREILPKDYGGDEISLLELNELWKKKLLEYYERFDALESMRIFMSPIKPDEKDLFGTPGNFKTLSVD